jgi:hypothetical protein
MAIRVKMIAAKQTAAYSQKVPPSPIWGRFD